jgi:small subunit ribosomal protein S8
MIDTIADLINRINNSKGASHTSLEVPFSKMKLAILDVLKKEGYIAGFEDLKESGVIRIDLEGNTKPFKKITRLSKSGRRLYVKSDKIPRPKGGYGIVVLSTPEGVLSGEIARKAGVGGELICEVY